jgi:hypothetical protein
MYKSVWLSTSVCLMAVLSSAAIAADWSTSYGVMGLPDTPGDLRIFAHYASDNGRIIGQMRMESSGPVITGTWVENDSGQACSQAVDGSLHWGEATLRFNAEYTSFSGEWNYCGSGSSYDWTGSIGVKRVGLNIR